MKNKLFYLLFCTVIYSAYTQNSISSISGKVTSTKGEVLYGVTVLLENTNKGVATNEKGNYTINNIPSGYYNLLFSYVGFISKTIQIRLDEGQQLIQNVSLDESITEINQVTVKGVSQTEKVRQQPFAVNAISTKSLSNMSADIQGVLNTVEGVRIRKEGGLGSNAIFSLYGFSGNQIKFFKDGIPMDNFGSSLSLNTIAVNSIDRIEVYNGVVPVALGTDALGGAINIITKQNKNYFDASYTYGSFNTHRASVNGSYTNINTGFTVRGNINFNHSDNNYKVFADIKDVYGNILNSQWVKRFHDKYTSGAVNIETGFVNKSYADQLLLGITVSKDDNQIQTGSTMSTVYGGILREGETAISTLKYKKNDLFTEGLDAHFRAAYNNIKTNNLDALTGIRYNWLGEAMETGTNEGEQGERNDETLTDSEFTTQFNLGYELNSKHTFAFNHAYQYFKRKTFDVFDPDKIQNQFPKSLNKNVLGVSYSYNPNNKWNTTFFGKSYFLNVRTSKQYDFGTSDSRIDAFKNNTDAFGYGVATSYFILENLQLKASYEHTYRMPTATEIFGDNLFVTANPELGPEQSDNFNVNARVNFETGKDQDLQIEGSFIYRNAKDLIYQKVTIASPMTNYENLSEVRTIGYAGNIKYSLGNFLRLGANLTFQDITDQANYVYSDYAGQQVNYQKGFRIPNTPYFFGNANLALSFKNVVLSDTNLTLSYFGNYTHEYFLSWAEYGSKDTKKIIPEQFAHDIAFTYSLKNGIYNITLECRNLTDKMLFDQYKLQKPGRAFYVKFRYAFN
ncbi:MAG: TonB-dependent receptor [Aestuariibaculum sp.]